MKIDIPGNLRFKNPWIHILYWIFVIVILTVIFGRSWGNTVHAFYFVSMLLPVVLGTSYFFNYVLVVKYLLKQKIFRFFLYTFYLLVVSLYLQILVLTFSFVFMVNYNMGMLGLNANSTILLASVMYILVFIGSFLMLLQQLQEKRTVIEQLSHEKEKMRKSFIEVRSQRKLISIPLDKILFIESLSDYVIIHTITEQIQSKEKISKIEEALPANFIRIHRSFIVNENHVSSVTSTQVIVAGKEFNIGRKYKGNLK